MRFCRHEKDESNEETRSVRRRGRQGEEANDPSEAEGNMRMMKMLIVRQGGHDMRPDKQHQGGCICVGGAYFNATRT